VEPVLTALARRTVVDPPGVDAAFAVHAGVLAALRDRPPPPGPGRRPVVLVLVAAREARPLVAHVLAGALGTHGVDARIVGGPVGPHHAVELTAMTRARAVVMLGERADADLEVVDRLAREQPDLPQFVMVPDRAAGAVPLGRSVHRARTFTGLLHEVLAVATASADG
jgi:hypothetical protein